MQKTYRPKAEDIKRKWYLVDAKDKILGRLAVKVAVLIRGKHKAIFSPDIDTGDAVIVINASKIKVTGRKLKQNVYRRYSGYPGGLREVTLENMLKNKPATVIQLAVERMLPHGPLGTKLMRKLKVYADDTHPHASLKPEAIEV